jgi:protein AaeX
VRFTEIDLFGVYVAPMSLMLVAAWVITIALRRFAARFGLLRYVWHPSLFVFSVYMIVLSTMVLAIAALMDGDVGLTGGHAGPRCQEQQDGDKGCERGAYPWSMGGRIKLRAHRRGARREAAEVQFDLFFAASHSADAQFRASAGLLTSSTASMHPFIAAARLCRIIAAPASCRYLSSHTSSIRNPL